MIEQGTPVTWRRTRRRICFERTKRGHLYFQGQLLASGYQCSRGGTAVRRKSCRIGAEGRRKRPPYFVPCWQPFFSPDLSQDRPLLPNAGARFAWSLEGRHRLCHAPDGSPCCCPGIPSWKSRLPPSTARVRVSRHSTPACQPPARDPVPAFARPPAKPPASPRQPQTEQPPPNSHSRGPAWKPGDLGDLNNPPNVDCLATASRAPSDAWSHQSPRSCRPKTSAALGGSRLQLAARENSRPASLVLVLRTSPGAVSLGARRRLLTHPARTQGAPRLAAHPVRMTLAEWERDPSPARQASSPTATPAHQVVARKRCAVSQPVDPKRRMEQSPSAAHLATVKHFRLLRDSLCPRGNDRPRCESQMATPQGQPGTRVACQARCAYCRTVSPGAAATPMAARSPFLPAGYFLSTRAAEAPAHWQRQAPSVPLTALGPATPRSVQRRGAAQALQTARSPAELG